LNKRRKELKKLMLLAALLAMAVVAAVPAIAQVEQPTEQEVESGDTEQTFDVTGGGDNSNACQMVQGINNTGNAVNNTSLLQYASEGELEVEDTGSFEISPDQSNSCEQQVNQAASASG
jgi:ABC-type oligopeptide transport system substrate-binding subunit